MIPGPAVSIIIVICAASALAYAYFIVLFTSGWFRKKAYDPGDQAGQITSLSVIVPARNEEKKIQGIMSDLVSQSYPAELFEVIVVDDFSEDRTVGNIKDFIAATPWHSIHLIELAKLPGSMGSKKGAISAAIKNATGDLIVTTDADCRLNREWLAEIAGYFQRRHPEMIFGPVAYELGGGLAGRFQALQFLSLVALGAGAANAGHAMFCNGANLAYTRRAFEEVDGFNDNQAFLSGDDVFLMHKIKTRYGSHAVHFLKSSNAIVRTSPQASLKRMLAQQLRWVSKSKGYRDMMTILVALSVYIFNLLILATLIGGIFRHELLWTGIILFGFKCVVDFPLLIGITGFVKQRRLLVEYILFQIFYVPFVVIVGIAGYFIRVEWKGRQQL